MLKARTRKVGNSIMISIPKELAPQANVEYIVAKSKGGTLIMAPKISNPYKSSQEYIPAKDNAIFEKESIKEIEDEN